MTGWRAGKGVVTAVLLVVVGERWKERIFIWWVDGRDTPHVQSLSGTGLRSATTTSSSEPGGKKWSSLRVFFHFFLSLSFWASLAAALHKVLLCSPSGGFFHRTPASHAMHSKTWGPPIYHFSPAALNPLAAAPSRIYYIPPLSFYFTLFYNIDNVSQYRM